LKRIKTNEHVALFAAFLIFIYLNSGISRSEPDTITPTNPFQVTLSLTGARVLNVVIDPAGYRPGEKADFTIIIQN
jgi:hypothetical protein